MKKTISNSSVTTTLNLPSLTKYRKMIEDFGRYGAYHLARLTQEMTRDVIYNQYAITSRNVPNYHIAYRSKGMRQHLEYRLFAMPLSNPVRISPTSYEIVLVPDPN